VNFDIYNKLNNKNRVPEAIQVRHSHTSYILSKYTMKSAYYLSLSWLQGHDVQLNKPNGNRESFWKYQLDFTLANRVRNYLFPENFSDSLRAVVAVCNSKGIELHLFIPPTHVDLVEKIHQLGLGEQYARFKQELPRVAPTIDFDVPTALTSDSSNFHDPFHGKEALAEEVIEQLWAAHLNHTN
jgi:hypothetical protein